MVSLILIFEIKSLVFFSFIMLVLIKNRDISRLFDLLTAFVFGVTLEYLNVVLKAGYYYNTDFILEVGNPPHNIPLAIGLSWAMLLLTAQEISKRFKFSLLTQLIFESAFVVSTDIVGDVIAIRLENGFWTWNGIVTDLNITSTSFLGVGWLNYIGWYFVIFFMSLLLKLINKRIEDNNIGKQIIKIFIVTTVSYILLFTVIQIVILTINLSWLTFGFLYFGSIIFVLYKLDRPVKIEKTNSLFLIIYYAYSYIYSLVIMTVYDLGLVWWVFVLQFVLFAVSMTILYFITDFKNLKWDAI